MTDRQPGRLDGEFTGPIHPRDIERLLCDCDISRIVTGPDSLPLDVGRMRRNPTPAMRRALVERDGGCRWPGCDRPAGFCDAHHVEPWQHGGETKLTNLVLLCSHHHHVTHKPGLVDHLRRHDPRSPPTERHRVPLTPRRGDGGVAAVRCRSMSVTDRLEELGLTLPGPYPPHDPLDAVVVHGGRARTSGQLPRDHDGTIVHPGVLGAGVTVEQGADAARWCALNALSVLAAELGDLDRVERVLTVLGFVASAPGFVQQPAVVDGASRLLRDVFGDAGRHSRSAIGVAALPRGGAVEIEVEVALAED